MERFAGILIEHYAGRFPAWLAPSPGRRAAGGRPPQRSARREVAADLEARGLRVSVDERGESVGRKIRDAELRKLPFMVVIGDQEVESGGLAVRSHDEGDSAR